MHSAPRRPQEASYTNNVEFVGRGGQRRKRGESAPWLNWPRSPPNVFHPPSHRNSTGGDLQALEERGSLLQGSPNDGAPVISLVCRGGGRRLCFGRFG